MNLENILNDRSIRIIAQLLNRFIDRERNIYRFDVIDSVKRARSPEELLDALYRALREVPSLTRATGREVLVPSANDIAKVVDAARKSKEDFNMVKNVIACYALSYSVYVGEGYVH
ncbi:MAG: hypothetical protein QXP91_11165 [Candidatus Methanomethylicia archaeon]